MKTAIKAIAMLLVVAIAAVSAAAEQKDTSKGTYAVIETSMGTITIKLFADKAPKTVANFVGLAKGTKA